MNLSGGAAGPSQLQTIGDWKLLDEIGYGSFARVFSAVHVETGVQAAVKAVNGAKLTQKKLVDSLQTEVQIQKNINHPNVVRLLDYIVSEVGPRGEHQDTFYLVLEFCDGGDLGSFLKSRERSGHRGIDEATTRKLLRQLAMGLKEMHDLRIVHRDFKPANILLASTAADTCLKIADFGFARALAPALLAETLCGSPLYMAPEVLGGAPYDSRADLWSVGVIMFEMLVGSVPFTGNNIVHLKRVIDTTEATLPPDMRQQLSPACQDLLRGLLQKKPALRLSFDAFFKHPFLSGQPLLVPHHLPSHGRLSPGPSKPATEATDGSIEQDWLILDGPVDECAPGIMDEACQVGVQDSDRDDESNHSFDEDPVMRQQAAQLPCRLTDEELLYGAALRVADIAGWKSEAGDPLGACSLQLLAVRLLDRLLTSLSSPQPASPPAGPFIPRADVPPPAAEPPLDRPPQAGDALLDISLSSVHAPLRSHDAGSHGAGCCAADAPGALSDASPAAAAAPEPLELGPKRQRLLAGARSLFARLLHSTHSLANDLARRDRSFALPCSLGLVWQGMLSVARSAGMDEMFGAYKKALRGYAQAANLVWLLRHEASAAADDPPTPALERISSSHSNTARASLPAVPEHPAGAGLEGTRCGDGGPSASSSVSARDECRMHGETSPLSAPEASPRGSQHEQELSGDLGPCRTLVDALQAAHQGGAPPDRHRLPSWRLTAEQEALLDSYLALLYQRHAACLHPPVMR